MNSIRLLAPSLVAVALASCASQKTSDYDTSDPYGASYGAQADPALSEPANPVYDTPAAYEESAPAPDMAAVPDAAAPSEAPSNGSAIIHTVVKGDTLSGISAKYKIPIASIKQANRMTNDVVVLGRKMVIPPR